MALDEIGVVMHGVTGRMGKTQHLIRSVLALRDEGGVPLRDGRRIVPRPILVGRNSDSLAQLARAHNIPDWGPDIDAALADPRASIFFDAGSTIMRENLVERALAAGKHVYTEKPLASTYDSALKLARSAKARGKKHGVVHDKLWLPGLVKLKSLIDSGALGRILSVKIDFGYWVFDGRAEAAQRPSWNYRSEDGGGIVLDMFPHWHYVIENLFGRIDHVYCATKTQIAERVDERGQLYAASADDEAHAIVELETGAVVQIASSWCTRVRRDDLAIFHVDGEKGSAVAGLTELRFQPAAATPRPVWNPDQAQQRDFYGDWLPCHADRSYDNAFRAQWALFIRHCVEDTPFPWNFFSAAAGVRFAETALQSAREKRQISLNAPQQGRAEALDQ